MATTLLGSLVASVQTIPTVIVAGASALGQLVSTSISTVSHTSTSTSNLGAIIATADSVPSILPSFQATFDALQASSSATVIKKAEAIALLGSIESNITSEPTVESIADSQLGSLNASAQSSAPTPPQYAPGKPYYQPKKKSDNKVITPKPIIIDLEPEPLDSLFKTIFSTSESELQGMSNQAKSRIDFSIIEDEAELILIL